VVVRAVRVLVVRRVDVRDVGPLTEGVELRRERGRVEPEDVVVASVVMKDRRAQPEVAGDAIQCGGSP
jgi:hypothetical protein